MSLYFKGKTRTVLSRARVLRDCLETHFVIESDPICKKYPFYN